jgi:hypothetical protein
MGSAPSPPACLSTGSDRCSSRAATDQRCAPLAARRLDQRCLLPPAAAPRSCPRRMAARTPSSRSHTRAPPMGDHDGVPLKMPTFTPRLRHTPLSEPLPLVRNQLLQHSKASHLGLISFLFDAVEPWTQGCFTECCSNAGGEGWKN